MAYCKECYSIFPADPEMKECPYCGALNFKPSGRRYVSLKEVTEFPFNDIADTDEMIENTINEVIGSIETELTREEAHKICWDILRNTLAMCITSDDFLEEYM